jgi:hypothetical protein
MMGKLGIKHIMTTAYHPQSNGMLERFHHRLKDALRAKAAVANWSSQLPLVMLGLCSAPREDSGISAAELVFGSPLQLPGQMLAATEPPAESFVRALNSSLPSVAPLKTPPSAATSSPSPQLLAADFVYIRSPPADPALATAYCGPYVVHKGGNKVFIVKVGGKYEAVTLDRLKPHLGGPTVPAAPPRRGRPPGRPDTGSSSGLAASSGGGVVLRPVFCILCIVKIPVMLRENPPNRYLK